MKKRTKKQRLAAARVLRHLAAYHEAEAAIFKHCGHKPKPGTSFFYALEDDTKRFWCEKYDEISYANSEEALGKSDRTYSEGIIEGPYRGQVLTIVLVHFITGGDAWMVLRTDREVCEPQRWSV